MEPEPITTRTTAALWLARQPAAAAAADGPPVGGAMVQRRRCFLVRRWRETTELRRQRQWVGTLNVVSLFQTLSLRSRDFVHEPAFLFIFFWYFFQFSITNFRKKKAKTQRWLNRTGFNNRTGHVTGVSLHWWYDQSNCWLQPIFKCIFSFVLRLLRHAHTNKMKIKVKFLIILQKYFSLKKNFPPKNANNHVWSDRIWSNLLN